MIIKNNKPTTFAEYILEPDRKIPIKNKIDDSVNAILILVLIFLRNSNIVKDIANIIDAFPANNTLYQVPIVKVLS